MDSSPAFCEEGDGEGGSGRKDREGWRREREGGEGGVEEKRRGREQERKRGDRGEEGEEGGRTKDWIGLQMYLWELWLGLTRFAGLSNCMGTCSPKYHKF